MPALCQRPASPSRARLRRELGGRGCSERLPGSSREHVNSRRTHSTQSRWDALGPPSPSATVCHPSGWVKRCAVGSRGRATAPRRVDGHRRASSSPACEDAGAAGGQLWPAGRLRFQGRQAGSPTPTLGRSGSWLVEDGAAGMHAVTQADVAPHGGRLRPRGPSGAAGGRLGSLNTRQGLLFLL